MAGAISISRRLQISSHRTVGYDDVQPAAQILAFANMLLDLLNESYP